MKITSLGYNPVNQSNQNYKNKQQNAPAFKSRLEGTVQKQTDLFFLLEHMMNFIINSTNRLKRMSLIEQTSKDFRDGATRITHSFQDKELDVLAQEYVQRFKEIPATKKPEGMTLEFIPDNTPDKT